jgi:hypothetical protein
MKKIILSLIFLVAVVVVFTTQAFANVDRDVGKNIPASDEMISAVDAPSAIGNVNYATIENTNTILEVKMESASATNFTTNDDNATTITGVEQRGFEQLKTSIVGSSLTSTSTKDTAAIVKIHEVGGWLLGWTVINENNAISGAGAINAITNKVIVSA